MTKKSIRFYNDKPVRAVYEDKGGTWFFSVLDVVGAIRNEDSYEKNRNYWKYLKSKLKKEDNDILDDIFQVRIVAPDGKSRLSDVLSSKGIVLLDKQFPTNQGSLFLDWFTNSDNTLDEKSKKKAYSLFESGLMEDFEVGTVKGLRQIHAYIFGGLFDFAGQIRKLTISKNGFTFANADYLPYALGQIERMPEDTYDHIMDKYVEMNVAHPFLEGNGRSTRIWLDLMPKKSLGKCVDWLLVDKREYLDAMKESVADSTCIKTLLSDGLTDRIKDLETFRKGIDYSYYYEQE